MASLLESPITVVSAHVTGWLQEILPVCLISHWRGHPALHCETTLVHVSSERQKETGRGLERGEDSVGRELVGRTVTITNRAWM